MRETRVTGSRTLLETPSGRHDIKRIGFGLKTNSTVFQRVINVRLRTEPNEKNSVQHTRRLFVADFPPYVRRRCCRRRVIRELSAKWMRRRTGRRRLTDSVCRNERRFVDDYFRKPSYSGFSENRRFTASLVETGQLTCEN